MWSDSSEVAGHDGCWTQVHELPQSELVKTWRAANDLTLVAQKYAEGRAAAAAAALEENLPDVDMKPEREPMLHQLRRIQEHIFAPAAMASGQKGLAHKAGAFLHQVRLELPQVYSRTHQTW